MVTHSRLHRKHCVVSLSKTLYPLSSTDSTQEMFGHERKIADWDVKNQIKPNKITGILGNELYYFRISDRV